MNSLDLKIIKYVMIYRGYRKKEEKKQPPRRFRRDKIAFSPLPRHGRYKIQSSGLNHLNGIFFFFVFLSPF